ncbi:MAG TPA: Do family serine endopeptidase [Rudaea sp.]|nr:Do family serine endopeptidase [Rudaea sp.]
MPATTPGSLSRSTLAAVFALSAAFFAAPSPNVHAGALPAAVDGQPLPSLAPMLERVVPAVVNINSKTRVRVRNPLLDDPFFRQFFGMQNAPRERIEQSLGSGVIVDAAKGYVLTNNHVVEGADDISVTLHDGRTLKAKLVGTDPDTDIAVVQISAENLTALPLADVSKLRMGDFVVAVGDPFGIGQSASAGIVSGLGRTAIGGSGIQNFIQTDAPINPGNSGGALVNLRGELVGINSAIISPSGASAGIGFAIPVDLANDVMRQLVATGTVKHGSLGLETQDLTPEIASAFDAKPGDGAVVTRVRVDTPAAEAGIRAGDVIVQVNGHPIHSDNELHNAEGLLPIGSAIELKLLREGKPLTVSVRLVAEQLSTADGAGLDPRLTGAELSDTGERLRREGLNGVTVNRVAAGSRAAAAGLKAGDLIIGVNQAEIAGIKDLKLAFARHPRQAVLSIVRGRNAFFLGLE